MEIHYDFATLYQPSASMSFMSGHPLGSPGDRIKIPCRFLMGRLEVPERFDDCFLADSFWIVYAYLLIPPRFHVDSQVPSEKFTLRFLEDFVELT